MSTIKARYDGLANWYDDVMRDPSDRGELAAAAYEALALLLGQGTGWILDIGCGTGLAAERVRKLGYQPFGVDVSVDQLSVASSRLSVVQGDAANLPVATQSIATAYSTFVSSDLDEFQQAVAEAYRVLQPGGRYISVCLHPCFNGGFSTLREDGSVLVTTGYRSVGYQSSQAFGTTIRSHVGAWHRPLAEIVNAFLDEGFTLARLIEVGPQPLPSLLGLALVKPTDTKEKVSER